MGRRKISYDSLENTLGSWDRDDSTNRRELDAAKAVLRRVIAQELTERQQECVRLYFFEGLTEEEAGLCLGLSKSTVCRHLQRAKVKLRRAVSYAGTARKLLPPD